MSKGRSKWAQKRAEMLHHPYILGDPQQRGQNQSGPKRGRKCYITPAFSGIPKQRGTKSELAASTLPSGGPKSGRKCYITPAFSGVPNKGDKIKAPKKKQQKTLKKNSTVSLTLPRVLHAAPTGD